jgi:glycosyltransferase involved in cell wall biosynthesis
MNFTVLISLYKNDNSILFERALSSIFNNSLIPYRVLLVVDGPIGLELDAVVNKFIHLYKNLYVLRLDFNVGLSNALNEGLKFVETEWVVRADSDDFNRPNRFELLSKYMTSDLDLIGSFIEEVDLNQSILAVRRVPLTLDEILNTLPKRNPFNHMSVAFRTNFVRQCGGYPDIYLKEDYALWATMLPCGARAMNISDILVSATTGQDFYKRRGGAKYALAEFNLQAHLIQTGFQSYYGALFIGIVRSAVFLMPATIREYVYLRVLRK